MTSISGISGLSSLFGTSSLSSATAAPKVGEVSRLRTAHNQLEALHEAMATLSAKLKKTTASTGEGASVTSAALGLDATIPDVITSREEVNALPGEEVDPSKPFYGFAGDPNFEPGFEVGDGAFTVNGATIQVFTDDTIETVLARITASSAGVNATWDEDAEAVRLSARGEDGVTLGDDTSGFLAAVKLEGVSSSRFTTVTGSALSVDREATLTPTTTPINGTSTATVTLDGDYDGPIDDTFTFVVRQAGEVGESAKTFIFDVLDSEGNTADQVWIPGDTPPDTPVALDNGITIALSAGTLEEGDTFQVNATAAFSEPPATDSAEDLSFLGVEEGTFSVNGADIDVVAGDSIDDVLQRINGSDAGVEASWSDAASAVVLRNLAEGPASVTFGGEDTSGFLAAMGLDDGGVVLGQEATNGANAVIADVGGLGGISSGSFEVNGVEIAVDIDSDTLQDVVDRINASGSGVRATLDLDADRIELESIRRNESFQLDDGDSGFFSAIGVDPTTYKATGEVKSSGSRGASEAMRIFTETLEALFETSEEEGAPATLASLVGDLKDLFSDGIQRAGRNGRGLGITFRLRRDGVGPIRFWQQDQVRFRATLRKHPDRIEKFFTGKNNDTPDGMLSEMMEKVEAALGSIEFQGEQVGLNLDTYI